MTLKLCGLARSGEILKPSYLYYHNAYGHKTWQDGDFTSLLFIKSQTPKSRCPAKSRGKLKSYIHYGNVCGYKTWQGGDIHWEAFFNKFTQTLDQVVLQGHVKYWSVVTSYTCVSLQGLNKDYTTTRLVATKLVKVMTYYEKLSSTNLHNPWTSSHIRPCDELKIFPLLQSLWPQNLACILYSMRSFPS